jgi:hypothetical protein
MPRKPIGETAMTDAERQARYRAARMPGAPVTRHVRSVRPRLSQRLMMVHSHTISTS